MNRAVIVTLAGLYLLSCSAMRVGGGVPATVFERTLMTTAVTAVDSTYMRETSEFMRIVAPRYWRDSLAHLSDISSFRASVEKYFALRDFETRPDTPDRNEWREEMDRRVQYCRENLDTPIHAPIRDVRWDLILPLGRPSFTRRIPDTADIDKYVLTWDTLGLEIACKSMRGGGTPVWIIPLVESYGNDPLVGCPGGICAGDVASSASGVVEFLRTTAETLGEKPRFTPFPGLKKIITTNLAPFVFPNDDGTSDLWLATLTRGDQFSDSTIQSDRFAIVLSIYDQLHEVVGHDTSTVAGLKSIASVSDKEAVAVPGYVGCQRLAPGFYEYVVSLRGGDTANLGVYRDTITIPTRRALRGASDVMIAFAPGVANGRGIARHGMQLHANPCGTHAKSDSLAVYVEFPENVIPGDEYRVTVSMILKKNAMVNWQPNAGRERTLYSSILPRVALNGKFYGNVSLADMNSGRYFLSVQIASQLKDPIGEEPVMAWTEIEVK